MMCLNKQPMDNNHRVELYVKDLNYWINFYITQMGFNPVKIEDSTALLSDGYTLLKIRKEGRKRTEKRNPETFKAEKCRIC